MRMSRRIGIVVLLALGLMAAGCSSDVQIGAVISESGAVAAYGEKVKKGLELALEEVNTGGGLDSGGKVILLYKDDATIPKRGEAVTKELIEQDGVRLIIGAVSSRVTLAIAPICEAEEVLLMSPSSSSPDISQAGDYVYRNYPSDIREGTSMAKFAKDLGLERIVIIAMDDEFGRGLRDVFTQQYESRFRSVVGSFDFFSGVFKSLFFGVAIAALLLGEALGLLDVAGVAVIAAGILAVQLSKVPAST